MVASSLSLSLSSHLFHHLLRPPQPLPPPPPPSSFFSLFLKPLLISTTTTITKAKTKTTLSQCSLRTTHFTKSLPPLFCHSLSSFSTLTHSPLSSSQEEEEEEDEEDEEEEEEEEGFDDDEFEEAENGIENLEMGGTDGEDSQKGVVEKSSSLALKRNGDSELKLLPSLTVKEKKELASYAHSLGKKLKSQLVGKSGVTVNVASSFIETLEANELLKIKIHNTCPGELDDAVKQLEEATGSVVVGQIGRTVIIYRPSITKMKAEEKKRQARKVFVRKDPKLKHTLLNKAQQRLSGRGRRGSSRFKLESDI